MAEHKLITGLDYTTQLIGNNDTRFSLVYVRKSGEPYSVTFDGYDDAFANDRSDGGYDAAYIPTGASDPNVVFASAAVADAVMAHVNGSGLAGYKSRQIILDEDNPYDSQGRYNIVGVDPDDGLFVRNKDGQSSYQWNLGFKYQF